MRQIRIKFENGEDAIICKTCSQPKLLSEYSPGSLNNNVYICRACRSLLSRTCYKKPAGAGHLSSLLRDAKKRAQEKGLPFTITKADIIIPARCPILDIPIFRNSKMGPCDNSPSIDRIDNALGYTPGNIRIISHRANALKSNFTLDELKRLLNYLECTGSTAQTEYRIATVLLGEPSTD